MSNKRETIGVMSVILLVVMLVGAAVMLAGCASPAADYVRAEQAAWAQFDPFLDKWVDGAAARKEISPDKADALHQLNVARRARVSHAIAAIGSGQ